MEMIAEYVYTVFLVSVSGGLMLLIAPNGQNDGIRCALRYLISLSVVLALVSPLHGIVSELPEMFDLQSLAPAEPPQDDTQNYARAHTIAALEQQLGEMLTERFGAPCTVQLTVTGEDDAMIIECAVLHMQSDPRTLLQARDWLADVLGCAVQTDSDRK